MNLRLRRGWFHYQLFLQKVANLIGTGRVYGCAASLHAAAPGVVPETDLTALTPAAFRTAVDEGRLVPGAPETQRIGGKVALATFLAVLGTPAFEEALVVARQG